MNIGFSRRFARAAIIVASCGMAASAAISAPPDMLYIHCHDSAGDFRISELNHTISQFSDRYQQYRTVCRDCNVTEWGDRITMKDGTRIFVQVNRITGDVSIQRNDATGDAGPFDVRSFHGSCAKGNMVSPNVAPASIARAF